MLAEGPRERPLLRVERGHTVHARREQVGVAPVVAVHLEDQRPELEQALVASLADRSQPPAHAAPLACAGQRARLAGLDPGGWCASGGDGVGAGAEACEERGHSGLAGPDGDRI